MLFNSYVFIFAFLPVVLLGFAAIGRTGSQRAAMAWLVAASLFFYGWWNPVYLVLIGCSILFNYVGGLALAREWGPRRALLALGVSANLGLLGYFKYANFFVDSIAHPLGLRVELAPVVLPLAISFFTFQQIAYLVDAYRRLAHEESLLRFALFVSFFPQLIAGPIVHHKEMLPQFAKPETYRLQRENLEVGLTLFMAGLFKKAVIADGIAQYATPAFDLAASGTALSSLEAWIANWAYAMQIYFDFSGYSDMAVGLGRMIGVKLPVNFNSPYKSTSIIEFWRRWHMTLSRFLRDYIFLALGGNRSTARRNANLFLTMLIGGIWHGAGWTYVIWGTLHGAYLLVNHAWRGVLARWGWRRENSTIVSRGAARVLVFFALLLTWSFFRAADLPTALSVIHSMISPLAGIPGNALIKDPAEALGMLALLTWLVWFAPNTNQILVRLEPVFNDFALDKLSPRWQWISWQLTPTRAVFASLMSAWAILRLNEVSEFLYFQF